MTTPAESAETRGDARTWDAALAGWTATASGAFLRAYSDAVNERLLARWLADERARRLLKTDLFDEAVATGLVDALGARADHVVAIDVSPAVVAAAQSRYPHLETHCADARALPFADGAFDAVVSTSTLDHFESLDDARAGLAELRRVLEPGGRLLITLDNAANPLVLLRNALPQALLRRAGLVSYPVGATCGPRGLRRLLASAGFEIHALGASMHCPRVLARAAAALAPAATSRLLRVALALERLEALPSRYATAQFVAALARRR